MIPVSQLDDAEKIKHTKGFFVVCKKSLTPMYCMTDLTTSEMTLESLTNTHRTSDKQKLCKYHNKINFFIKGFQCVCTLCECVYTL